MASGMQMMLKSMGVDPEEIMSNVEKFKSVVVTAIDEVREAQKRLEAKQDQILALLMEAKPHYLNSFISDEGKFDHLHDDKTGELLVKGENQTPMYFHDDKTSELLVTEIDGSYRESLKE